MTDTICIPARAKPTTRLMALYRRVWDYETRLGELVQAAMLKLAEDVYNGEPAEVQRSNITAATVAKSRHSVGLDLTEALRRFGEGSYYPSEYEQTFAGATHELDTKLTSAAFALKHDKLDLACKVMTNSRNEYPESMLAIARSEAKYDATMQICDWAAEYAAGAHDDELQDPTKPDGV